MKKEKSNDDILKMRKFCEKHECKTCPYFSKKDSSNFTNDDIKLIKQGYVRIYS